MIGDRKQDSQRLLQYKFIFNRIRFSLAPSWHQSLLTVWTLRGLQRYPGGIVYTISSSESGFGRIPSTIDDLKSQIRSPSPNLASFRLLGQVVWAATCGLRRCLSRNEHCRSRSPRLIPLLAGCESVLGIPRCRTINFEIYASHVTVIAKIINKTSR